MHATIGQHNKHSAEDSQPDGIHLQRSIVEAKRAQDRRTRNFYVEAILMVDQTKWSDFIDDEAFKTVVEN
jgi:hypothetical protein